MAAGFLVLTTCPTTPPPPATSCRRCSRFAARPTLLAPPLPRMEHDCRRNATLVWTNDRSPLRKTGCPLRPRVAGARAGRGVAALTRHTWPDCTHRSCVPPTRHCLPPYCLSLVREWPDPLREAAPCDLVSQEHEIRSYSPLVVTPPCPRTSVLVRGQGGSGGSRRAASCGSSPPARRAGRDAEGRRSGREGWPPNPSTLIGLTATPSKQTMGVLQPGPHQPQRQRGFRPPS